MQILNENVHRHDAIGSYVRVVHPRCHSTTGHLPARRNLARNVLWHDECVGHEAKEGGCDQCRRDKCKNTNPIHQCLLNFRCDVVKFTQAAKRAYFAVECPGFQLK